MVNKNYAEAIKEMVDVREVAVRYGVQFNRAGFALCPFHSEKTASFKVKNRHTAHCFGCGITVDAISLTMGLFNLSFLDALERLNEDFGLGLPIGKRSSLRDRIEISRRVREIKIRTDERKAKEDALKAKRKELIDLYCKYEIAIRTLAPKDADTPPNPLYIEAVNKIGYIEHLLDSLPEIPT